MIGGPIPVGRTSIRIDVVGYRATGKSSLIAAVASETFSREFLLCYHPLVLMPISISIHITIIVTSSRFDFVGVIANFRIEFMFMQLGE